jgi:hypothetical protein
MPSLFAVLLALPLAASPAHAVDLEGTDARYAQAILEHESVATSAGLALFELHRTRGAGEPRCASAREGPPPR